MASIDWRTDPISPDRSWLEFVSRTPPDLETITNRAILESGRNPSSVDIEGVRGAILKYIPFQVLKFFKRSEIDITGTQKDLDSIFARQDFTEGMVWDYLTHQESAGIATYSLLAERLDSEGFIAELVLLIESGQVDAN